MRIKNTVCRYALILCWLSVLPILEGCGQRELSREKAGELMSQQYGAQLTESCALSGLLFNKAEFVGLQEPVCEAEFVVTGVRKISETQVIAEAKMVQHADEDAVREWLKAFEALERRLLQLEATKDECGFGCFMKGYMSRWIFTDETDGQQLMGNADYGLPADITKTREWETLQALKRHVAELAKTGSVESKPIEQPFQLFDDGWRLVQAE